MILKRPLAICLFVGLFMSAFAGSAAAKPYPYPVKFPIVGPGATTTELNLTYNALVCIIANESGDRPDPYIVDNHRGARGAVQWKRDTWINNLIWAEQHYLLRLTTPEEDALGARVDPRFASKYTQDLVTAFALLYRPQNERPWTGKDIPCWKYVGTMPVFLPNRPQHDPDLFIIIQINTWVRANMPHDTSPRMLSAS